MYLTKLAQRNGDNDREVKYSDLAAVVQRKSSMEFLHDIVPKKMKYKDVLALLKEHEKDDPDAIL